MLHEHVLHILNVLAVGPQMQTNLTELVWGTSGRGNTTLTNTVFPVIEDWKLVTMERQGRAKWFTITDKGRQYIKDELAIINPVKVLIDMENPGAGAGKQAHLDAYKAWDKRMRYLYTHRSRLIRMHAAGMNIPDLAEYVRKSCVAQLIQQ